MEHQRSVDALQTLDQLERSISSENPFDHLVSMHFVIARLDRATQ
jgi:hypothetical protein